MPATISSILEAADHEWRYWGQSTWHVASGERIKGHVDDEPAFAQYVIDAYCSVGGGSPSLLDIQDDRYYWSAVGMSAIMKRAGYVRTEFPFAQSHSVFLRHFIQARRDNRDTAAFWGYRIGEAGGQPRVGDIVAYARGKGMTPKKAAALFDSKSAFDSHTDVVVATRPGEIDVIGCNVRDSVTRKTLALDTNGHLADATHFWFAVLRRTPAADL